MGTEETQRIVSKYFEDLANGHLESALSLLARDIDFNLPATWWNAVLPYLGREEAVERQSWTRSGKAGILDYVLRDICADGNTAFAIIFTKAARARTRQEFEIEEAHKLVVGDDGKIASWKVYVDPNGNVSAFNADRDARLVEAIWASGTNLVGELIRLGADVNHRDGRSGLTPLMIAAGKSDTVMVKMLIDAGADVLTTDERVGATALHKACQGGSLAVVQDLVEADAFIDAVATTTGHTPLMDALWFKHSHIAKFLLDQGAGLNLATRYGFSLKEHFDYELNVNTIGKDRLLLADQYLKERQRADEAKIAAQQLMEAVKQGDLDGVRQLLASGAEVDERFPIVNGFDDAHTPLLVAARDGHTEIALLLLQAGADVNATEPTFGAVSLHKATYNGHADLTRIIAGWPDADLNYQGATNGYTPLHDALWHGYEECADALLDAGASLHLMGHDGKKPLDIAKEVFGSDHRLTQRIRDGNG